MTAGLRRHLAATVGSGVVIAAATLAAAVVTAQVVAGVITTRAPLSRSIRPAWAGEVCLTRLARSSRPMPRS